MTNKKIAIIAGSLKLPFLVADDLRTQGYEVFIIGLKNFADPKLSPDLWIRLGAIGTAIKALRKQNINKITMVGALGHINIGDVIPDLSSVKILSKIAKNQSGDDSMLSILMTEILKLGFEIIPAQKLCPALTFEKGLQTKTKPSKSDLENIKLGSMVSKTIGKLDIGQSIVVAGKVLAVEAAEGTKEMLARVIEMRKNYKKKNGVLIKLLKPGQDLRADIPAIGVQTVIDAADAKLNGIVINSKNCWAIDKSEIIKTANKKKIFILSV